MKHLVVVPAYNEQAALPATIERLQALSENFELLVVDDGSTDATAEIAARLAKSSRLKLHLLRLPFNCGIGAAVQTGYRFAAAHEEFDCVIQLDADGQHDVTAIPALIAECEAQNLDLCIGARFSDLNADGFRSTFLRRIGIRFLSMLIRALSGVRVTDPTSGFRCAKPAAWRQFADDYPVDYPEPESLARCLRHRLRVGEFQVRMFGRAGGKSSICSLLGLYYVAKVTLAILIDHLRARGHAHAHG